MVTRRNGCSTIKPSILQKFERNIKAYHVTNFNGASTVMKLQGKRKDIPAFTKGSEGLMNGAKAKTEVLFILEGKTSFHASVDLHSILDRNGIRWLRPYMSSVSDYFEDKFSTPMIKKIWKKYNINSDVNIESYVSEFSGQEKREFIKWYLDESKKILTKSFIKGLEKAEKDFGGDYSNDEVFVHDYKVLKAFFVIDGTEPSKADLADIKMLKQRGVPIVDTLERDEIPYMFIK